MKKTTTVDTARVELLLGELRLPGIKLRKVGRQRAFPMCRSFMCTVTDGLSGAPDKSHARRKFFELTDIAANARRGRQAPPISPIALEAVKRPERR